MNNPSAEPLSEMRHIDGIASELLRQIDNLDGLCAVLQQLGEANATVPLSAGDVWSAERADRARSSGHSIRS